MLTAAFGDLPSVDASGQFDVRDEKVDDPPPAPRQRLFAIGCMDHVVSFLSQSLHHELADERVVLDEEYRTADTSSSWTERFCASADG
jgi:hypothetical protein